MYSENRLCRLSDRSSSGFFEDDGRPYVLLFESRYDPNVAKMTDALQSALRHFQFDIFGAICVIEDAPALSRRFNIRGVPVLVAGLRGSELGTSLGLRSADELVSLIERWFCVKPPQRKDRGGEVRGGKGENSC